MYGLSMDLPECCVCRTCAHEYSFCACAVLDQNGPLLGGNDCISVAVVPPHDLAKIQAWQKKKNPCDNFPSGSRVYTSDPLYDSLVTIG